MQITIHSKGVQQGPFPAEQVNQLLQSGQISPSDLGWCPGMTDWKLLSTFDGLQGGATPPPLHASNPASPATSRTEPLAIWSLVLGIVSLVGFIFGGFLFGIPAVICGHIGRSRIQANPALRGAGIALAGLITGYISIVVVPVAIIAAIAIPNIANITQQAEQAAAQRNAQNFAAVASAARAAGYTGTWKSKQDAIQELIAGIDVNGMKFGVSSIAPEKMDSASEHLRLDGDNLVYVPAP